MDIQTLGAVTQQTTLHLSELANVLNHYLGSSPNQRAQLLGQAFASQLDELAQTASRIIERTPPRALKRAVHSDIAPNADDTLSPQDDSRALTTWLVRHLQFEHITYQTLLERARLGPGKSTVAELAALFLAQSKRMALEAHRFQDL